MPAFYAQGDSRRLPKGLFLLHRFILGINDPTIKVDHINRNGLDNRRENLRTATCGQNLANRPKARKNTSGFKGVYRTGKRWFAGISNGAHSIKHLGSFDTKEEAARAYDRAAIEKWGEFACVNFPVNSQAVDQQAAQRMAGCETADC